MMVLKVITSGLGIELADLSAPDKGERNLEEMVQ